MQGKSVYLDTSSLVKRYIGEKGSEVVDRVYEESEAGKMKISFSIWNIGEAVGVFDRYLVRDLISDVEFKRARADIVSESLKMSRLEALSHASNNVLGLGCLVEFSRQASHLRCGCASDLLIEGGWL